METIKVRGLVRIPAWMFGVWGAVCAGKGLYDLAGGTPEANLYAPQPWGFVTKAEWTRYAAFEFIYGAVCLGVAFLLWSYAKRLPETVRRKRVKREEILS